MALVIPIKAIYDADGKPIALGELQAGDKISLVYIDGAEASGSAAAAMTAHVAETDPHGQYALEAALGNAAYRNVGTALGTVAAGDDARLSDSREWTAATVLQADAEAGTDNTRKAWTALRVRQAIAAWWESVKASLVGPINITANSASDALKITQVGAGNALVVEDSASPDSSPFVINAGGQVVIGSITPRNIGVSPIFSLEGLGSSGSTLLITRNSADTSPSTFRAFKTRGAANGAFDAIGSNDSILQVIAYGADGAAAQQATSIIFGADGAVSAGIVPGKIIFYTTTNTGVLTEVCRMDSSQVLSLTSGKLKIALNAAAGKVLESDALGNAAWSSYVPLKGGEVAALPTPSSATKQARVLAANNRCYWSDGVSWIDLTATGGRTAEYAGLEAETYALIAAQTIHPSNARAILINALIGSLKSAGVWSKLGMLYLLAANDEQAARLNWKTPGTATLTAVNSPAFTSDRGFTGDGVSSYLSTGVSPSSIPGWTLDSASICAWSLNDVQSVMVGTTAGANSTAKLYLNSKNASSKVSAYINSAASATTAISVSTGAGLISASRTASAGIDIYKDGSLHESVSRASDGIGSGTVCLLRAASSYGASQMAFASIGAGLSSADQLALYNAVRTYLQALGAVA